MKNATLPPPETPPGQDLVQLDRDHPGFRDEAYRSRRNAIARVALDFRTGAVPAVEYSEEEHAVWRDVWEHLSRLHRAHACREVVEMGTLLRLDGERIPQLAELNPRLRAATGFEMHPVAGLVQPATFLSRLGERVFLSTQYMRHPSTPFYTPEPDVVHELVGHAATLMHPRLAELNRRLGVAAVDAKGDADRLLALERIYWFTLEFGAVREGGEAKAFGAGLLSSFGEIEKFGRDAELLDFDLDRMAATDYDPTDYQPQVFVAPSFDGMVDGLLAWLDRSCQPK